MMWQRRRRWRALAVGAVFGHLLIAPPADAVQPSLAIVSPAADDVVAPVVEVEIRASALADDIHLLAADAARPEIYRRVATIAAPAGDGHAITRVVDTTGVTSTGA